MSATIARAATPAAARTQCPPSPSTSIDTFQLRIPLDTWAPPPMFAGQPRTHVEAVYVRVTTNNGVVGWGECFGSSGCRC